MKNFLFFILILSTSSLYSQNKDMSKNSLSTIDLLTSKIWQTIKPSSKKLRWAYKYSKTELVMMLSKDGKKVSYTMKKPYYLSDKIEKKFDFSKVGKVENGKYIIVYHKTDRCNSVQSYLINKITNKVLYTTWITSYSKGKVDVIVGRESYGSVKRGVDNLFTPIKEGDYESLNVKLVKYKRRYSKNDIENASKK